ncbi:MAG: MipA/OmpV family protein [Cetobacterium sp.]|uniref:MipA/OmpV family protein n=1 Tax=Cetobacterium sp. TaxID=2071632 RepID=UPI003F2B7C56
MKKLLFFNLFLSSIVLANNNFSLGLLGGVNNSIYKTKKQESSYFLPNLDIQYNGLFIQGDEIGYTFWGDETLSLSIISEFLAGYPVKGKDLKVGYQNIEKRKSQIMTGVSLDYKFLTDNYLSVSTIFGEHGNKTNLSLLKTIYLPYDFLFVPSIYGNMYSKDFSNYYFGVTTDEVQKNNSITTPFSIKEAYGVGLAVVLEKKLSNTFSIYTFGSYEFLSNKIKESPIVKKDYFYTVGGGLKYTL